MIEIDLTTEAIEVECNDPSEQLIVLTTGCGLNETEEVLFDTTPLPPGASATLRGRSVFTVTERTLTELGTYHVKSGVRGGLVPAREFHFRLEMDDGKFVVRVLQGGSRSFWLYGDGDPRQLTPDSELLLQAEVTVEPPPKNLWERVGEETDGDVER